MTGDSSPEAARSKQAMLLDRLSQALDIPQETFFDPATCDLTETSELLRLWLTITDGQDRAKVLAVVRTIASHARDAVPFAPAPAGHAEGSAFDPLAGPPSIDGTSCRSATVVLRHQV